MDKNKLSSLNSSVEISYSREISDLQKSLLLESSVFNNWYKKAQQHFDLKSIRFLTALEVKRRGEPFILFCTVQVEALGGEGQRLPGRLLLRGDACVVLVVLKCRGEDYLLLVKQDRLGCAEPMLSEAVAGMLDGGAPLKVAQKETFEETGLKVSLEELIPLSLNESQENSWLESVGMTDESLHYYAVTREVSEAELEFWNKQKAGCAEENEIINTQVIKLDQALASLRDSKTIFSILLYLKMKERNQI